MYTSAAQEVRDKVTNWKTLTINQHDGYTYNQYETQRRIIFATDSKYLNGNRPGEKSTPYFNTLKANLLTAVSIKDIDTSDIMIVSESASNEAFAWSFLLRKEHKKWSKQVNLARFLNQYIYTADQFGGALVKFTKHSGVLKPSIVPWRNVVCDPSNIMGSTIIEKSSYTPTELNKMRGVWNKDAIKEAIKSTGNTQTIDGKKTSYRTNGTSIEVWEAHGEMPETYIDKDGDPNKYVRQVHIFANIFDSEGNEKDLELFSSKEAKSPYEFVALDADDGVNGRSLSIGYIEEGLGDQQTINEVMLAEYDFIINGSKAIGQAPRGSFKKKNTKNVRNNTILEYDPAKGGATPLNLTPASAPLFDSFQAKFKQRTDNANSAQNILRGEQTSANVPLGVVQIQNNNARNLHDQRLENLTTALESWYDSRILEHLVERINKAEKTTFQITKEEREMVDQAIITYVLDSQMEKLEKGDVDIEEIERAKQDIQSQIDKMLDNRSFSIPKKVAKNIQFIADVRISNEKKKQNVHLANMSKILMDVAQNPAVLTDPQLSKQYNELLEAAGFSPFEIRSGFAQQQTANPKTGKEPLQVGASEE